MWRQKREWRLVELLFVGTTVEAVATASMGSAVDAAYVAAGDGGGKVAEAATGGRVDESAR